MIVVHLKSNKNSEYEHLLIYFFFVKIKSRLTAIKFLINLFSIQINYLFLEKENRAMASCCMPNSPSSPQFKQVEWMTNLPLNLHDEPITKIAIPGKNSNEPINSL